MYSSWYNNPSLAIDNRLNDSLSILSIPLGEAAVAREEGDPAAEKATLWPKLLLLLLLLLLFPLVPWDELGDRSKPISNRLEPELEWEATEGEPEEVVEEGLYNQRKKERERETLRSKK